MTPLVWSRQAEDDLAAIRTYIARDSEHYAQDTVDRLLSAVDRLLLWPRSGRVVPEAVAGATPAPAVVSSRRNSRQSPFEDNCGEILHSYVVSS